MKAISLENTAVFDVVGIMGGGGGRGWRRAMPSGNFMHSYTTKLFLNQLCNQLSFHKYSSAFAFRLPCLAALRGCFCQARRIGKEEYMMSRRQSWIYVPVALVPKVLAQHMHIHVI